MTHTNEPPRNPGRFIEELLAARGIMVTDEAIRPWCLKFGQDFANAPRRHAPRRGDQ